MVIKIYNFLTKQLINSFQIDGSASKDLFSVVQRIESMQKTQDILNVGRLGMASFGISRLYTKGNMVTNLDSKSTQVITGICSYELRASAKEEDTTPPNVLIDGEDVGIKVGLIMYDPGWVLKSGKQTYNIFGIPNDAYLKSIGSRNLSCTGISAARKFKNMKALIEYVLKNRRVLEYMVKEHGYSWSYEPSCDIFLQDFEESASKKKYQEFCDQKDYLSDLMDDINTTAFDNEPDSADIPAEATEENVRNEILYRMAKYKLSGNSVSDFKKTGKIYRSEFGGMIYNLDEGAEKAIAQAKEAGLTPWHVISDTLNGIGTIHTVLYVSGDTSEWASERGDRNGFLTAFCWNQDQSFGEFGAVQVSAANGGLVRVA